MKPTRQAPIAITGVAGRFPDAPDAAAFWKNLAAGVESLREFSDVELAESGIEPRYLANRDFVKKGTILDDAESFDASFFGYTPREAQTIDPQQRIFLECCWAAMENAGYPGEAVGARVGVFAGASMNTYFGAALIRNPALLEIAGLYQLMIGNDKDFLATRVSYELRLTGPGVTVQTACSTSLVAVQMACQSLQAGQCDMALAGGVALRFPQKTGHLYIPGMIFSRDGHCRPFDADASGIRGGAGAGVVVLKRLDDALADGDPIRAVILGAAVNNDGAAKMGYTAPSVEGQAAVIRAALEAGGVNPESISYIEAHGTATPVGDPIEIAALERAFRGYTDKKGFCAIGSVKGNIGHLDTAAGVAGLIKTVLALEYRAIPPSINFRRPNTQIDFANSPFFVNDHHRPWNSAGPRRAGVSSFGIGGTNAHVVLEEAPAREAPLVTWPAQLLLVSARTSSALETMSAAMADYLREHEEISFVDACYTTQIGRKRFPHRRFAVCSSRDEAIQILTAGDPRRRFARVEEAVDRPVTFMFTGQGAQHPGMGRELYGFQPVFRREFDFCADVVKAETGFDLQEILYASDADASLIDQTAVAQPALFALEYSLARMWESWGVRCDSAIGHSIGEYVAACLAAVFSVEDALRLVCARGKIMQSMPAGNMLAVRMAEAELRGLIDGRVCLAAVNAPSLCTVSGSDADLTEFEGRLQNLRIESRRLHTSHAFHSSSMDLAADMFRKSVARIELREPMFPFSSNVTGLPITGEQACDPGYWAQHLRQTVHFALGIRNLATPGRVFLEVGPGQTLATFVSEITRGRDSSFECEAISSLPDAKNPQSEASFVLQSLGKLWAAGIPVNWEGVHGGERLYRVPLPAYAFERQRYWPEPEVAPQTAREGPTLPRKDPVDWFYLPAWTRSILPSAAVAQVRRGPWLIFADGGEAARLAAEELGKQGEEFAMVQTGKEFRRLDGRSYTINPAQVEDYRRLLMELRQRACAPRSVLFLWGLDGAREAFDSLLGLGQAFGDLGWQDPVGCVIVSAEAHAINGRERMEPEQALLHGPAKVMPLEYSFLHCQSVDICRGDISRFLIAELLAEQGMPRSFKPIAYRDGWRWTQTFDAVPFPQKPTPLRDGGVYLITGGMGGIGLTLASHLARTRRARIALVGRSPLPERGAWNEWLESHNQHDETSLRIQGLQQIEEFGGEILTLCADVCDRPAMQAALAGVHRRFGPVQGVIHAAGVAGAGSIQLKTREAAAKVLNPKVQGTLVLEAVMKDEPLDFFLLCSSINAICGMPGAVDYTAANAFLDSFAASRQRGTLGAVISVGWDAWQEVGMAVKTKGPRDWEAQRKEVLASGIKPHEGADAFERILAAKFAQVAVVTRDLPRLLDAAEQAAEAARANAGAGAPSASLPEPEALPASARANAAETETHRKIAEIWENQLGIHEIGIDDNFFEMGGHSLLATAVLARVSQTFGLTIALRTIFEAPTVRALAERVENLLWASLPVSSPDDTEEREEVEL